MLQTTPQLPEHLLVAPSKLTAYEQIEAIFITFLSMATTDLRRLIDAAIPAVASTQAVGV